MIVVFQACANIIYIKHDILDLSVIIPELTRNQNFVIVLPLMPFPATGSLSVHCTCVMRFWRMFMTDFHFCSRYIFIYSRHVINARDISKGNFTWCSNNVFVVSNIIVRHTSGLHSLTSSIPLSLQCKFNTNSVFTYLHICYIKHLIIIHSHPTPILCAVGGSY